MGRGFEGGERYGMVDLCMYCGAKDCFSCFDVIIGNSGHN